MCFCYRRGIITDGNPSSELAKQYTLAGYITTCLRDETPLVVVQNPFGRSGSSGTTTSNTLRLPNFKPLASGRICQFNPASTNTFTFNPYSGDTPGTLLAQTDNVELSVCLNSCLSNSECNYINYFYYKFDESGYKDTPLKRCQTLRVCGEITHGWNPLAETPGRIYYHVKIIY